MPKNRIRINNKFQYYNTDRAKTMRILHVYLTLDLLFMQICIYA